MHVFSCLPLAQFAYKTGFFDVLIGCLESELADTHNGYISCVSDGIALL